jgi:glycine cleavage system transcriptional repressor
MLSGPPAAVWVKALRCEGVVSLLAPALDSVRRHARTAAQTPMAKALSPLSEVGSPTARRAGARSYRLAMHALDHPGIARRAVTAAIGAPGGNVVSLQTSAYEAAVTGSPLFEMELEADFPPVVTAAGLREALAQVSEAANADIEVGVA